MSMWRKSSYSGAESNCVEVAFPDTVVGLRDSKNPDAGHLTVSRTAFAELIDRIKQD